MSRGNVSKIILVGYLGHPPELRHTAKGMAVMSLSVATHQRAKERDSEGKPKDNTLWHKATIWGKKAELCAQYLHKGSRIYLEGQLQMKSWTDKDGIERKNTEILVDEVHFLDAAPRHSAPAESTQHTEEEIPALA